MPDDAPLPRKLEFSHPVLSGYHVQTRAVTKRAKPVYRDITRLGKYLEGANEDV
jgi:hypothetical protein